MLLFALLLAFVIAPAAARAQRVRSGSDAFAIEAAGASAGSLLGAIAAYQVANATRGACGSEDLSCLLRRLGLMGVASAAGAAGGDWLAGRAADTRPSFRGGALGAVVGVAAGVGVVKGLDELGVHERWTHAVSYAIVQGLVTAAGSRLFASR